MVDAENEVVVGTKSVGCWVSNGQDVWITRSSYFGADDLRGVTWKERNSGNFVICTDEVGPLLSEEASSIALWPTHAWKNEAYLQFWSNSKEESGFSITELASCRGVHHLKWGNVKRQSLSTNKKYKIRSTEYRGAQNIWKKWAMFLPLIHDFHHKFLSISPLMLLGSGECTNFQCVWQFGCDITRHQSEYFSFLYAGSPFML